MAFPDDGQQNRRLSPVDESPLEFGHFFRNREDHGTVNTSLHEDENQATSQDLGDDGNSTPSTLWGILESSEPIKATCLECGATHDYDSTCRFHGNYYCRACFARHAQRQLSNSPYHGVLCPWCRGVLDNDVVQELLPFQSDFQRARRLEENDQVQLATQVNANPVTAPDMQRFYDIAGATDTTMRPWRGGQRSGSVRGFETVAERAQRRAANDRSLAQGIARQARIDAEEAQWRREREAEAEEGNLPVDHDMLAPWDEGYPDGDE